ncbi:hypothetical protein L7F22_022006 [Adiantum nelumboides]|nr:hypothetical protein [Adiantum nelumboides]
MAAICASVLRHGDPFFLGVEGGAAAQITNGNAAALINGDREVTLVVVVGIDPHDSNKRESWEWLEEKEEGSVLYISFGTIASTSRKELQELTLGIEAAGVPFLWVIQAD